MNKTSVVGIALGVAAIGYFGAVALAPDNDSSAAKSKGQLVGRRDKTSRAGGSATLTRMKVRAARTKPWQGLNSNEKGPSDGKTDFSGVLETLDDKTLSDMEREIIGSLRDLVDVRQGKGSRQSSVYSELGRLLQQAASQKNAKMIGLATKKALLGAARSVGSGAGSCEVAAALLDYITDANAEIAQTALSQFLESVSDFSLSDRERAQLVVAASISMSNEDDLGWAFSQFPTMRHSVAVNAFEQVARQGNATAQALLAEQIANYTGDEAIQTPEQAKEWLAQPENADGPDDEAFYGGMKPGDGIGI